MEAPEGLEPEIYLHRQCPQSQEWQQVKKMFIGKLKNMLYILKVQIYNAVIYIKSKWKHALFDWLLKSPIHIRLPIDTSENNKNNSFSK